MFLYDNEYFQIRYLSEGKLYSDEDLLESIELAIEKARGMALQYDYTELWLVLKRDRPDYFEKEIEPIRQLNKYYRDDIIQSCLKEIYEF